MAKDQNKPAGRARTEDLRREIEHSASIWHRPLRSRTFGWGLAIWAAFVVVVGAAALWTSEQPLISAGRVMRETRTNRVSFEIEDEAATGQLRSTERARARRVYVGDAGILEGVRDSLESLPQAVQGATKPEDVEAGIRQQFGINAQALDVLKRQAVEGEPSDRWKLTVGRLHELLMRHPILSREVYQVEAAALGREIELRLEGRSAMRVPPQYALNIESPRLAEDVKALVGDAGFAGVLADVAANRVLHQVKPTYTFDASASAEAQDAAAARVPPKLMKYPAKEVIFRRGDVLTAQQLGVFRESLVRERAAMSEEELWAKRGALVGLIGAIALAMAWYAAVFVPRIRRNPARMGAVGALFGVLALAACYATAAEPSLIALTATAPTVLCAVVLCIAYNQRVALAFGALHGLVACAALDQSVGMFAAIASGVGAAVWTLKEIRDRDALIRMGGLSAAALFVGIALANLVELPVSREALKQALWDGALAGFGGLLVAGVTLFILPTLEKAFGIMTGMTLVELRDPKQPLLRQLQQRAPGTYNHSLNLAALGEAAADAIGADGLLTYVGALYHDIGKMNKPDYFVENQTPGFNRHDKLTPAMSLLVIVGHVKDGLELAREFNLPRPLWHFIESHHGTTLVEYFYHRARRQAEHSSIVGAGVEMGAAPSEMEYRYPGPRPGTKEAAIILLCDAVESASRTMADPTPGRIDALVRAIATKRLMDGQFDECDLTLRELNEIVEAVSKTLASIYHGRIAYPGGGTSAPESERARGMGPMPSPQTQVITPAKSGNGAGIAALSNPVKVGSAVEK